MNYTTYNLTTGQIYNNLTVTDESMLKDYTNVGIISGHYNADEYKIINGQTIRLADNPSNEIKQYNYDYSTMAWVLDQQTTNFLLRDYRNKLLIQIDRINPVWYASLTAEQQQALVAYRQQLLDVPQQSGFPTDIEWPAKPTWL
jgi:hypothetical protein